MFYYFKNTPSDSHSGQHGRGEECLHSVSLIITIHCSTDINIFHVANIYSHLLRSIRKSNWPIQPIKNGSEIDVNSCL